MGLFELIKDPERAERCEREVRSSIPDAEPAADPELALPLEVQRLRRRAREVDARERSAALVGSPPPLDATGQEFLGKCLAAAATAAEGTQDDTPDLRDPHFRSVLRVCAVPVLTGDWPTVLSGRGAAMAAAAELSSQGFANPGYQFTRDEAGWTLHLKFGF